MAFLAPLAEAAAGAAEVGAAGAAEGTAGGLLGSRSGQFMLGQSAGAGKNNSSSKGEKVEWSYPSNT